jgi:ABC-type sugar transport system ATPase subunit
MTATYGIGGATHAYAPGVPVLRDVSIELRAGRVHALVGENGSGKSTLIKLLTGVLKPQLGTIRLDGEPVSWSSPAEAQEHGIGVVHQDYNLFPDMTVAQNVAGIGGSLPRRRWTKTLDSARIEREVARMLSELGIELSPERLVRTLDPAERKFVEIVRAMRREPRFMILDEPTASLLPEASASVLGLIRRLRDRGIGLCFVSHRLDEVLALAEDVTCLRDGRPVCSMDAEGLTHEALVEMIVGRREERRREAEVEARQREASSVGEPVVVVKDLRLRAGRPPVELELMRGEILGLTGLLGSGAATVVHMLGGAEPLRGSVDVHGKAMRIRSPRHAVRAGIGFIPEDRKALGAIPDMSVAANVSLASLGKVSRAGVIDYWGMRERAVRYTRPLDLRAPSVDVSANTLSGGNLQKVLLAKWLASGVDILAIEEPTHGIDIGGKVQVHDLLRRFVADGGAIAVALSEVDEALELCDRIAVFSHGALKTVVRSSELTHAELRLLGGAGAADGVA